jgi:hypothetical protein
MRAVGTDKINRRQFFNAVGGALIDFIETAVGDSL